MVAFGSDFQRLREGYLYNASSPWKLWQAILIAMALLLVNIALQAAGGFGVLFAAYGGDIENKSLVLKSMLIGIFPAALVMMFVVFWVAKLRGGNLKDTLGLRFPDLGWAGWLITTVGFVITMYAVIIGLVFVLGIDMANYLPSADGSQPAGKSAGLIESEMFALAKEPLVFWFAFLSIAIGAPLAEELVFRGQLFTTLRQSVVGPWGAVIITSAAWSIMHINPSLEEPWFAISIIFFMGIALGWLLLRTGSLWVTIICHSVWNGIFALAAFFSIAT